jgi:hypothetical protein
MSNILLSPGFSVTSIDENNESVYSNTMMTLDEESTTISSEKAILTWLYKCFPRISSCVDEETFMSDWLNHETSIQ